MACRYNKHLTPECIVLSPAAITGVKELGMDANFLCKIGFEQNERDNFIRCRTMSKVAKKIDSLDVGEKLKNIERRQTNSVDKKN